MTVMRKKPATYDDLVQLPESMVGEILDGELFASPRPAVRHARAATTLGADVNPFDRSPRGPGEPGGWWILGEPELHLGRDVVVPDLGGWRRERMARLPDTAAIELPPDWVCEVLSPSTARLDRSRKMPLYARQGVAHLWFVDATARLLEVYRLRDGEWVVKDVFEGDARVRAEPFEALELDLGRWWLPDEP
jgi:Uma2 family endonuclease